MEKYNEHIAEQARLEAASMTTQEESSLLNSDTLDNNMQANVAKADGDRINNRKQSVPTWVLLLLLSIFGLVMSLPFLEH